MATNRLITNIIPTVAPRLPSAPVEYDHRFQEQYSNVLRLYFNGIDTTFGGLLGSPSNGSGLRPGGSYLNFPYGSFSDDADFNFTASNSAEKVVLTNADFTNSMSLSSGGIKVEQAGIYNYQFSIQFVNTDSQAHNAWVWLRVNTTDVVGTGSKYDVPSSHGSSDGYLIAVCNFYLNLQPNDVVYLYAATAQAQVGATDGVYMEAYAAQTSPFAMPSIPSVVATLSFVSSVPT